MVLLRDIERFVHTEHVHLSGPALAALLRADISISVLSGDGRFLGSFLPPLNTHAQARLRQYQRTLDPAFTRAIAAGLVAAKLYNQRRVLQRLKASRPGETPELDHGNAEPGESRYPAPSSGNHALRTEIEKTLGWLDAAFASLRVSQTVDEIRGYEGATTARYFAAWATFLPPAIPFDRRSTRPPLNPVNACISFAATILYTEMVAFLRTEKRMAWDRAS